MRLARALTATLFSITVGLSACSEGGSESAAEIQQAPDTEAVSLSAGTTPYETWQSIAGAVAAQDWNSLCSLKTDGDKQLSAYPDLLDECINEVESDYAETGQVAGEAPETYEALAAIPEERTEVGENGVGSPQLRFYDEAGESLGYTEFQIVEGLALWASGLNSTVGDPDESDLKAIYSEELRPLLDAMADSARLSDVDAYCALHAEAARIRDFGACEEVAFTGMNTDLPEEIVDYLAEVLSWDEDGIEMSYDTMDGQPKITAYFSERPGWDYSYFASFTQEDDGVWRFLQDSTEKMD